MHPKAPKSYRRPPLPKPPASPTPQNSAPLETDKLQKVLASAGLGSRREMELWIAEGRVRVNGASASIGQRVSAEDRIEVDGRAVRARAHESVRVLLYHKPQGEIVSRQDPEGRPTVFENLPRLRGTKWIAVGRLDFNTSGLLVFTTSGELANRLTHPSHRIEREYAVRLLGQLSVEQIQTLRDGVELEDGPAHLEIIEDAGGQGSNHWYNVVLAEGRNREVRRLFEAVNLTVSRLMRVRFGPLELPARLKRGQMHELEAAEIKRLFLALELDLPATAKKAGRNPRGRPVSERPRGGRGRATAGARRRS